MEDTVEARWNNFGAGERVNLAGSSVRFEARVGEQIEIRATV